MDDDLTRLLTDLRIAIHHALADDAVSAALAALEQAGRLVNVALDVTLLSEPREDYPHATTCFAREGAEDHLFSPSDALFLHVLGIADS